MVLIFIGIITLELIQISKKSRLHMDYVVMDN